MSRTDWYRLVEAQNSPLEIDISVTPLGAVNHRAKVVGSFAERSQDGRVLITIFRDDPQDVPNNINVDKYEIWENVYSEIEFEKTVTSASTSNDSGLRSFLDDYVFIVPIEKGIGHHLPELPTVYRAILEKRKPAS